MLEEDVYWYGKIYICPAHNNCGCWCVVAGENMEDLSGDPFFPVHNLPNGQLCPKAGRFCTRQELESSEIDEAGLLEIRRQLSLSEIDEKIKKSRLFKIGEILRHRAMYRRE